MHRTTHKKGAGVEVYASPILYSPLPLRTSCTCTASLSFRAPSWHHALAASASAPCNTWGAMRLREAGTSALSHLGAVLTGAETSAVLKGVSPEKLISALIKSPWRTGDAATVSLGP